MKILRAIALITLGVSFTQGIFANETTTIQRKPAAPMQALDNNHDGAISKSEFMARCERRFQRLDTNGDGKITPEERQQAQAKMREKAEILRKKAAQAE